jgi:hypothetical protein
VTHHSAVLHLAAPRPIFTGENVGKSNARFLAPIAGRGRQYNHHDVISGITARQMRQRCIRH